MKLRTLLCVMTMFFAAPVLFAADAASAPASKSLAWQTPAIPDGLGVNIHFCDPRPDEMKMLAEGGFRIVRMDFAWAGTEHKAGEYDFSAYDRLLAALEPHGIKALFILDYSNKLYDKGLSPCSDEGRKAFARWAVAAVTHFKGKGVLWEMYNEPNIQFWKPEPKVQDYIKLALEVGKAIRQVAPDETYFGAGTSEIDLAFLGECFKAGLLEYWDAVSVHPYRQKAPETVAPEYARLRQLIDQYKPQGKSVPILSGEWGYSIAWGKFDEVSQGKMLPREWMINLACNVPVSIWYDWHDDGTNAKDPEHHFGTVKHEYFKGRDGVYDPKPAYLAARTFAATFKGFVYNKRLALDDANDYVMLFSKGDEVRLAAWTISRLPHQAVIPASAGKFVALGHTGETLPELSADANGLAITLSDAPQYLTPQSPNDLLRLASAWESAPLETYLPGRREITLPLALKNPLGKSINMMVPKAEVTRPLAAGATIPVTSTFDLPRTSEPVAVTFHFQTLAGGVSQRTIVHASDPLTVKAQPITGKTLVIQVDNPAGLAGRQTLRLTEVDGFKPEKLAVPLEFVAGQTQATVSIPVSQVSKTGYRFGMAVGAKDEPGFMETPVVAYTPADQFSRLSAENLAKEYKVYVDGDKSPGKVTLSLAAPSEGPPAEGASVLCVAYEFDAGWKFACLSPLNAAVRKMEGMPGNPKTFGLWVYGDESGCGLRLRFHDSTGQCFQPSGSSLKWKGWRYVTFPMQGALDHWGGANDGVIHYPVRWDSMLLIDGQRKKVSSKVYIACPMLMQ